MSYDIGPYDPCPCGSGKKYKFCCAAKAKDIRHGKFPIGTVAHYGPDDKTTTKIAAGVILREGAEAIMERFMATDILLNKDIGEKIKQFFAKYGVKNFVFTSANMGCPHEEGIDFPNGQECPFCPFWAGKQGIILRDTGEDSWGEEEGDDGEFAANVDIEAEEEEISDLQDERDCAAEEVRICAILGDSRFDFAKARSVWLAHLQANLQFPFEVNGIEDFQWEERYVIGGWSQKEYQRLKKTQPSYRDRYQLLSINDEDYSEWMMFGEDLAANAQRNSDGKKFILGLAELKATDKQSPNYQLLHDFSVWLVNSR